VRLRGFDGLRAIAALSIVVLHVTSVTGASVHGPLSVYFARLDAGVAIFFVISGYLLYRPFVADHFDAGNAVDVPRFYRRRALRIYPALVAATLLTILLAGASSTLAWPAFLAEAQTVDYAWRVALGWEIVYRLPGAFPTNPFPHDVNGSLWTLPIELRLYVGLLAAGVVGLLARRAGWLAAVLAMIVLFALRPEWFPLAPNDVVVRELALLFGLGSLAYAWRDAIPVSLPAAAVALALVALNPGGWPRGALFAPLLAYLVLAAAYHPRLQWPLFNRTGDYSYGLYVYSFPLQQTLMQRFPALEPMALFALSLPLGLAVAAVSWHALERPALALKSRFDAPKVSHDRYADPA